MSKTTQNTPVSPQADTPVEVVYQPEGSLPPITSLDELSHIRAIDKQGRSVTMTPAQLRELTGIDYSKLEEQELPNVFWVGTDGVKKQVYAKTVIVTLPPSFTQGVEIAAGINGVREIMSLYGNIRIGDSDSPITDYITIYARGDAYGGSIRLASKTSITADRKIVLTATYTKR